MRTCNSKRLDSGPIPGMLIRVQRGSDPAVRRGEDGWRATGHPGCVKLVIKMNVLRTTVRVLLSILVAFLLISVWLRLFDMFQIAEWGVFHSGLPLYIVGGATYWLLGRWRVFRRQL